MRIVIQRVSHCEVAIEGNIVGNIGKGMMILLGVEAELLVRCGAVSGETARAMAAGAAAPLGCDITVAVTGVAGPGGGTAEKPVGTVYIGLYHRGRSSDQRFCFSGTRRQVQEKTTHTALDLVRRALLKG